jgi:CRP-like cAMP-binding protein
MEEIKRKMIVKEMKKDEILFRKGSNCDRLFFVLKTNLFAVK